MDAGNDDAIAILQIPAAPYEFFLLPDGAGDKVFPLHFLSVTGKHDQRFHPMKPDPGQLWNCFLKFLSARIAQAEEIDSDSFRNMF